MPLGVVERQRISLSARPLLQPLVELLVGCVGPLRPGGEVRNRRRHGWRQLIRVAVPRSFFHDLAVREQVEHGVPPSDDLSDPREPQAGERELIDQDIERLGRSAIWCPQGDDLLDLDPVTEKSPPPGSHQPSHGMGHQYHRTPLCPAAELAIQELGGMCDRLPKVVGERK